MDSALLVLALSLDLRFCGNPKLRLQFCLKLNSLEGKKEQTKNIFSLVPILSADDVHRIAALLMLNLLTFFQAKYAIRPRLAVNFY